MKQPTRLLRRGFALPAGVTRRLGIGLRAGAGAGNDTVIGNCADAYSPAYDLNIDRAQASATTIVRSLPFSPVTG